VITITKGGMIISEIFGVSFLLMCVATVMLSINMPFMFKLGVEKGRIVFFLIIMITVFVGTMSGQKALLLLQSTQINTASLMLLSAAAALLINYLSIGISEVIYRKRTV
jgi:cation transport ATPase